MKFLIGNWKMAPDTPAQAIILAKAAALISRTYKKNLSVAICIPSVYLATVGSAAKTLILGAQNVSAATDIASTGQISTAMLRGMNVTYCIVGHSECRAEGESNELVKQKIDLLLSKKIKPILCVGEKSRDEHGWYLSVIKDQIESAFSGIPKAALKHFIIAYEPIWAIGASADREATPVECREMIIFIRKLITDLYDEKVTRGVPILFGGSVHEGNARAFMTEGDAAGLLVGRVSLTPKRFAALAGAINF